MPTIMLSTVITHIFPCCLKRATLDASQPRQFRRVEFTLSGHQVLGVIAAAVPAGSAVNTSGTSPVVWKAAGMTLCDVG